MNTARAMRILMAASLAGQAGMVAAVEAGAVPTTNDSYLQRIEPTYIATAGSADNLANLADGLRNATPVTLAESNPDGSLSALTFTPPTRPMGYGNITRTLDYATRDLTAAGIDSPTSEQLHAALMGGTVINAAGESTVMPGVLQLRSQGMGWGRIAHTLGIHPSPHAKASVIPGTAGASTSGANGIVTANGGKPAGVAAGVRSGKSSIVTAGGQGASSAAKTGNAYGHARSGIVTAGGANGASHSGIVNAHGNSANADGLAASRVSTAGGSGNGNAFGKVKH